MNRKKSFFKTSMILTMGTTFAQAIPIVFYPILSRLYTPAEFGILATISAVFSLLALLATGQYQIGILVAENDSEAMNIITLSLLLSFIISFLSIPFVFILSKMGALSSDITFTLCLVIALCSFSYSIFKVYNEWCVRKQYFNQLTINKITNSGVNSASKLGFAFINSLKHYGLVWGELIGRCISALMCIIHFLHKDSNKLQDVKMSKIKSLLIDKKKYPLFYMPGIFIHSFAQSIPIFIFGKYYSQAEVGYFSMAMMIIVIPINIIGLALYDAFRQKANEVYVEKGNCHFLYKRMAMYLFPFIIFISVLGYFILPPIIPILLGPEWVLTGTLSAIMCSASFLGIADNVFGCMWVISDKVKYSLYYQLFYFLCYALPPMFSAINGNDIQSAVIALAIGNGISYIVSITITYNLSKGNRKNIKRNEEILPPIEN